MNKQELEQEIEFKLKFYSKKKEEFLKKFNEDSYSALEWGSQIAETSANERVWLIIQHSLKELDLHKVFARISDEVLRGARYPQHSTSPMSNYMKQLEISAWAQAYEFFKSSVDFE